MPSPPTTPTRRSAGAPTASRWAASALAVLKKEFQVEWRSRQGLGATVLYSICALTAMAYTLAYARVGVDVKAVLLWLIILFAAMSGLARTFVREEDMKTADSLRMAAPASAVLAGKMALNVTLTLLVEAITVPLFLIVMPTPLREMNPGLLLAVFILGGIGLAGASTFVAALVSQAGSSGGRGALFFVVAFPALIPVLMAAVSGTLAGMAGGGSQSTLGENSVTLLLTYDVVAVTAAFLLFGWVWSEA